MTRSITVPAEVVSTVRHAITLATSDVPEVAYRLASGFVVARDLSDIALWGLDNAEQYTEGRATMAAALRGGHRARTWAIAAATIEDTAELLTALSRSDAMLVPAVQAAIITAWERTLDHVTRKARSRLNAGNRGPQIEFAGWPNRDVVVYVGADALLDKVWIAFDAALTQILADYARTQGSIVGTLEPAVGVSVARQITTRAEQAVATLVAFLDQRMRDFILGDIPYIPQDLAAARAVASWVSGAGGAPAGFTFDELSMLRSVDQLSTAEEAVLALGEAGITRMLVFIHGYYGAPLRPFDPHVELDGEVFSPGDAALLTYYPGDHSGCRCALVPTWS